MSKQNNHYSFLVVGKTQDSNEASGEFKRYVGVASSFVLDVNPDKKTLDALMGYESANAPEYVKEGENGKEVNIHFIVKTDPEFNDGIEITNRLMFTLRNTPAYNRDKTKVQVIDDYGNHSWANIEDVEAGKPILSANGNPQKIDTKYRKAASGECDLVDFLKAYLCVPDVFNYANNSWVKKENPAEYEFKLEHIKDYFNGDFSELKEALKILPNNKVKLLYGVRTTDEGKQRQVIASKGEFILRNNAGSNALLKLEKDITDAKQSGAYTTTIFKVQPLQEYTVEPTNLQDAPAKDTSEEMPWD